MSDLKQKWPTGTVRYVVIEHVSSTASFRVEYTPERLDNEAFFKLVILGPEEQELTKVMMDKVEKLDPVPSNESPYVRWGFVFLDSQREPLASIYLDRTGSSGFVNKMPVTFASKALFTWAEETFEKIFR